MPRRNSLLPRPILPESVEIGDKIRVTFRAREGVTMTYEGVVGSREDIGPTHIMSTREGGLLYSWNAHRTNAYTLELLDRPPVAQATLPGMEDVRDRIA
jgi:hypothetical protein